MELPSHVFEFFASDPRVLALLASPRRAGRGRSQPAPPQAALLSAAVAGRRAFAALEKQDQVREERAAASRGALSSSELFPPNADARRRPTKSRLRCSSAASL